MKKLIFMLTAVFFLFAACEKEVDSTDPTSATPESGFHKKSVNPWSGECTESFTTPMIAGGGKYDEDCEGLVVGFILVEGVGGGEITITYELTEPGWVIDVTHLYVGPLYDAPPQNKKPAIPVNKKGNPKIGHFDTEEYDPAQTTIPISVSEPTGEYVIAAHANVRYGSADVILTEETFCEVLPATATLVVVGDGVDSYMTVTISDAGWLDGVYEGWCIDQDHEIKPNVVYKPSDVFCTLNGDADPLFHDPDHIDEVNWILNQGFVGTTSPPSDTCGGIYTAQDVQDAIWFLVDDKYEEDPTCRTNEIIALALANGDGYVPGCGDYVAVAFNPHDPKLPGVERQKIIIAYPLTCDQQETAWGYGYMTGNCNQESPLANGSSFTAEFGGNAWGWYFYGCQPPQD